MRSLSDIYNESVETRNKYLELSELTNDSKMSIINAISWTTSSAIYAFESLLNTFMLDVAKALNGRINGTPMYYANALLKFQYGDNLIVSDDGTSFQYSNIDESKRVITSVSYEEIYKEEYKDNVLSLKCAKGTGDNIQQLSEDELIAARAYINQIKFAGVKTEVVSRKGDVLIPRLTVYYDGAVSLSDLYDAIDKSLFDFFSNMGFDSTLYAQKVIDAIQSTEHVVDVYVNKAIPNQGVWVAKYNDDGIIAPALKVDRVTSLSSGYLKQSTKEGSESNLPLFREALTVLVEEGAQASAVEKPVAM